MAGISTGVNPFPSAAQVSGGLYVSRSSTADITNNRPWICIVTDKTFYLWVNWNSSSTFTDCPMIGFGDHYSNKPGDTYNTFILANISAAIAGFRFSYLNTIFNSVDSGGMYLCRSYTQIGTSIAASRISDAAKTSSSTNMGTGGLVYPHTVDGSLYMAPVWIVEQNATLAQNMIRGVLPGIWNPCHNLPLAQGDTFQGSGDLSGKTFLALRLQPNSECMVEISDTW